MKILELNGSPRVNGNTQCILELWNERIAEYKKSSGQHIEYEIIHIYKENLNWCIGCRNCLDWSEENCPHKDRLLLIKSKMEQADLILIGSPVYVEDVSGGMKNFLDRMAFNCHRPFLNGKPVYCFTSSASAASTHALKTLKRALLSWGARVVATDQFQLGKKIEKVSARNLIGQRIEKRLDQSIGETEREDAALYGMISFGIQKRYWGRRKDTTDYQYWAKKGWLDSNCIYYTDIKPNRMKRITAAIISSIVGKWISS